MRTTHKKVAGAFKTTERTPRAPPKAKPEPEEGTSRETKPARGWAPAPDNRGTGGGRAGPGPGGWSLRKPLREVVSARGRPVLALSARGPSPLPPDEPGASRRPRRAARGPLTLSRQLLSGAGTEVRWITRSWPGLCTSQMSSSTAMLRAVDTDTRWSSDQASGSTPLAAYCSLTAGSRRVTRRRNAALGPGVASAAGSFPPASPSSFLGGAGPSAAGSTRASSAALLSI